MSLFEIKCPMCKGTLWVNPTNGEVVDHQSPDHKKADLNEFLHAQKSRGSELEDKFKKAKLEEEKRRQEMEQKFKNAKNLKDDNSRVENPFDWD
ncbi:MAG: hypothetical protein ACOC41_04940 [Chitinivibrionales bacterium]